MAPLGNNVARVGWARWAGRAQSCAVLVVVDAVVFSGVGACAAEELGVGIRVSSKWLQTGGLPLLLWLSGRLHACWSLLCPMEDVEVPEKETQGSATMTKRLSEL